MLSTQIESWAGYSVFGREMIDLGKPQYENQLYLQSSSIRRKVFRNWVGRHFHGKGFACG